MAEAAPPPIGDMFEGYNPEGALGGMFAPAYIKGFAPSEAAVAKWQAENHGLTPAMIDQTRMPNEWRDPNVGVTSVGGRGPYGAGQIPNNLSYGDPQGSVDPEALRIAAQGGKYDMNARRDAIAQRMLANSAAEAAYNKSRAIANPWGVRGGMLPIGFNTMSSEEAGTFF